LPSVVVNPAAFHSRATAVKFSFANAALVLQRQLLDSW